MDTNETFWVSHIIKNSNMGIAQFTPFALDCTQYWGWFFLIPPILPSTSSFQSTPSSSLAPYNVPDHSFSTLPGSSVSSECTQSQLNTYTYTIPSPLRLWPPLWPASAYYVITQGQEVGIFYDWWVHIPLLLVQSLVPYAQMTGMMLLSMSTMSLEVNTRIQYIWWSAWSLHLEIQQEKAPSGATSWWAILAISPSAV